MLITCMGDNKPLHAVDAVLSNNDLLTEILLRLPVISVLVFKTVSKRWLSLIKSSNVTLRLSQIPNIDPPSGLFLPRFRGYEFAPLDMRIPSNRSQLHITYFNFGEEGIKVKILQSCNGLLLCCDTWASWPNNYYYVYNPSLKLFKKLPQHHDNWGKYNSCGGMRMVFDPTKSPHYKVVHAGVARSFIQIETYSSETCSWSVCGDQFCYFTFNHFEDGIYWNGGIHWLNSDDKPLHFKLDIVDHPVLTNKQTPQTLKGKLFESRGCLLFVGIVDTKFQQFSIYEMNNWNYGWSMKYCIHVNVITKLYPKTWKKHANRVCSSIPSIVLGEKKADTFLVMELYGKVVQYNIAKKTFHKICNYEVSPSDWFVFIPSFARV